MLAGLLTDWMSGMKASIVEMCTKCTPNYTGGHKFHVSHIHPQGFRLSQHLYCQCIRFLLIFFILKKDKICLLDPIFGYKINLHTPGDDQYNKWIMSNTLWCNRENIGVGDGGSGQSWIHHSTSLGSVSSCKMQEFNRIPLEISSGLVIPDSP